MNELAPVLGVTAIFGFGTWFLRFLIASYREHKVARMQADLQNRLLEKFNSTEELVTSGACLGLLLVMLVAGLYRSWAER